MSTIAYVWVVLTVAAAVALVLVIGTQAAVAQAQRVVRATQRRDEPRRALVVSQT